MTLHYLEFDYSEDAEGTGSFDAMASAAPAQVAALQAEVTRVLDWAHRDFAGAREPLDEGGDWDYELQGVQEVATTLQTRYDAAAGRLDLQPGETGAPRLTLTLTVSGTPAFCEAFRGAFGIA
ncbi:hypothetical protein [Variovorax terrae]|uniref:Uncharacterized protein n=1 Tax=Variovorax terrae TaxID=2923278 RepID=A0A9X2APD9_9BURK|nr:hypothetical protein [Variovorax terrae]MCJ0764780.1 hypothetical protein [Variovorax terrae]